jgi:hypothetical protein
MKTCAICTTPNQDDAATCQACGEGSWSAHVPPAERREPVHTEERARPRTEKRHK